MKQIETISELNEALNKDDNLHIIKFYGTWCGPCRMIQSIIENIEPLYKDVTFYEVNVDDCEEKLLEEYGITSVPVLLFYKGSLQVDKTLGAIPESKLREKIEENNNK